MAEITETGVSLTGTKRGVRTNGFLDNNISNVVITDRSAGTFAHSVEVIDADCVMIDGVSSSGSVDNQLTFLSTSSKTPRGSIAGVLSGVGVATVYNFGANVDLRYVNIDMASSILGVDNSFTTFTDAGSRTVSTKRQNQVQRFAFGTNTFTYDLIVSDEDASNGDSVFLKLHLNLSFGAGTVNIIDVNTANNIVSFTGGGSIMRYSVHLVRTDAVWTPFFVGESLV